MTDTKDEPRETVGESTEELEAALPDIEPPSASKDSIQATDPGTPPDTEPRQGSLFCSQCGVAMAASDRYCHACGWDSQAPEAGSQAQPPRFVDPNPSEHNRLTVMLLCVVLGWLGVHRFYVGKVGTGIVWLVTGGLLVVGWIYDVILIATGEFRDANNRRVLRW